MIKRNVWCWLFSRGFFYPKKSFIILRSSLIFIHKKSSQIFFICTQWASLFFSEVNGWAPQRQYNFCLGNGFPLQMPPCAFVGYHYGNQKSIKSKFFCRFESSSNIHETNFTLIPWGNPKLLGQKKSKFIIRSKFIVRSKFSCSGIFFSSSILSWNYNNRYWYAFAILVAIM